MHHGCNSFLCLRLGSGSPETGGREGGRQRACFWPASQHLSAMDICFHCSDEVSWGRRNGTLQERQQQQLLPFLPPRPRWQLPSLPSLPHAQIFCLFNLFGEDLFHLPSKHMPIFLLTSRGGGADTKPVQNEIVDVWLPWGAGVGGRLGWDVFIN